MCVRASEFHIVKAREDTSPQPYGWVGLVCVCELFFVGFVHRTLKIRRKKYQRMIVEVTILMLLKVMRKP